MQIFVVGGIFGFIYETIFYYFDLGYIVKRGTTFGPWIPIYGFGSILILLGCKKYKNHPITVFLLSTILTGLLEFLTGYVIYHVWHTRLWDYNTEILNFGNIGGYICLRSVLLFGICSLMLLYLIVPLLQKINEKLNPKVNLIVTNILFFTFVIDIIVSLIL